MIAMKHSLGYGYFTHRTILNVCTEVVSKESFEGNDNKTFCIIY